jgi:hypothetical protein
MTTHRIPQDLPCYICGTIAEQYASVNPGYERVFCSPYCKILSFVKVASEDKCWPYRRTVFTWRNKSYSVRVFMYEYSTGRKNILPRKIKLRCHSTNCANPSHMYEKLVHIVDYEKDGE